MGWRSSVFVLELFTIGAAKRQIDMLTPAIVNEFIERINVHAPDKSSGHRTQQINIVYNFIGMLPAPQTKKEAA